MNYTVGQLAKLSGVTVRALHHYGKLGLLPPSGRTESGYRHYTGRDVLRLHRILVCKQAGVPLKDIAAYLGPDAPPLRSLLARQATAIEAELDRLQGVLSIIKRVVADVDAGDDSTTPHHLLELMNAMQSIQQHYTTDEVNRLHALRDTLTHDARRDARAELTDLLRQFREAESVGTDPADDHVRDLARRWAALGKLITPDDRLRAKTRALLDDEPGVQQATGITPELKAYIDAAVKRAGASAD